MALVIKFTKVLKRKISKKNILLLTDEDLKAAEEYYFTKATLEVKQFNKASYLQKFSKEKNGILYYTGRVLTSDSVTITGRFTNVMSDLSTDTFCVPIIDKFSPLAYSMISEIHWHDPAVKHSGIESVWRYALKRAYIIEGRNIVKAVKKSCQRCRYLEKKRVEVAMGPLSSCNLTIAPAFFNTQTDLCGPFEAFSYHHKRTSIKIWMVVFCCATTSATDIKIMEDYSSTAFIQAFIRFSCKYGYPKLMLSDEGSQLIKAFETMNLKFVDVQQKLFKDVAVEFKTCPVGGHNMNGKVERKIREIKISLEKHLCKNRLSIMQWETLAAEISNCINNLPLALGNIVSDYESMDLLTPNRLILGRNNERSPVGSMDVNSDPKRIFKMNKSIFNSWFETWLMNHVPNIVYQPKWFKTDDVKEGDVVLFLKTESSLTSNYQYGLIHSVNKSSDGKVRKVEVKYKNVNEKVFRYTSRAVRELVIIHHIDEIGISGELFELCK